MLKAQKHSTSQHQFVTYRNVTNWRGLSTEHNAGKITPRKSESSRLQTECLKATKDLNLPPAP
jgi:hypothetical protein